MKFLSTLISVCLFASLAGAAPQDNKELTRLLEEDQADYSSPASKSADGKTIAERHRARLARVRELNAQKQLQTGVDYSRAALMLQRGEGPEDYKLAQDLSIAAKSLDPKVQAPQSAPEQDCASGIPVCKSTYTQPVSYTGVGGVQEVGSGTCLYAESNSVWYIFSAQSSGSLFFTITTAKDYDFALYNISNGGCAAVPGNMPIRCNYSGAVGSTGLVSPALPELPALSVPASGLPTMPGVNVSAGQTYALIVNNYTGDTNGYTLTFSGTASITDTTPPSMVSATMDSNTCEIEINLSEPVRCSTIASDGSDFQLLNAGGAVVTGASGVGCGTFTTKIRLSYSLARNACGTWQIKLKTGTDGNTLIDNCQNSAVVGNQLAIQCPPPAIPHLTLPSVFCAGTPVIADGTASTGEIRYFWSVQQCDASGNPIGKECSSWFPGTAGTLDVGQFGAQNGCPLECGRFYRVKLAVQNCCTRWDETVRVIEIACLPVADAGPDKTVCCSGPQKLQIGSAPVSGMTYSWSPTAGLDNPSSSNPTIDFSTFNGTSVAFPSQYQVTVTNAAGCTATDTVNIDTVCACRPPARVKVEREGVCSTKYRLTADCACGDTPVTYLWSPGGQTTASIEVEGGTGPYTVTCRNACGATVSQSVSPPAVTILQGGFPNIQCPNVFTPNGDNVNDFWDVLDLSQAVGFVPAYNATDYELDVYDRWGSLIVILSGSTTSGFANGSIPHWDGVTNQNVFYNWWQHLWGRHDTYAGSPVSDGTYYYIFKMKNCTNGWTTICYGFITVLR